MINLFSLQGRIISSFIGIILLFVAVLGSIFIFQTSSISEYRNITQKLILQNSLTSDVYELMALYSSMAEAPSVGSRVELYIQKEKELLKTLSALDSTIVSKSDQVTYRGLKNIITGIINDLKLAREGLVKNDIVLASKYYNQAVIKRSYVEPNTTTLFLQQIEQLDQLQISIDHNYKEQLILTSLIIISILFSAILYALKFSQKITGPIKILSTTAERVAQGNYLSKIPNDLLQDKYEVGKLANSFKTMLDKLNSKINEAEKNNKRILETTKDLEEQNTELEKFNSMVINRELKMIELKERIVELESQLANLK